jgi:hypothetical protein
MTVTISYDAVLARVRIAADGIDTDNTDARVERSTDGIRWTTVRGASAVPLAADELAELADDYEFPDGVMVTYRVTGNQEDDAQTASTTTDLGQIWLKSVSRPFLNQPVTVVGWTDPIRASRSAEFDVVGRSLPVAVTEVRGSRSWTVDIKTVDANAADDLDLALAAGDVMFLHIPAGCRVPGGYVSIGDTTERRTSQRGETRVFSLPCREVAAPGPYVVGSTSTWTTVESTYADWSDVASAHPTWADLLTLIGDPSEVIVP